MRERQSHRYRISAPILRTMSKTDTSYTDDNKRIIKKINLVKTQ